jgi:TetR/AcrR family transcriptional regulator
MVSRRRPRRPPAPTRDRILQAALVEFAARGFDGAKTDRIAEHANVNKAMLYYHFRNKKQLYLEIIRTQFGAVAEAVEAVREAGGAPDDQLRRFAEAIAREAVARPHFPPMWLREIADGGRHLDASVIVQFRRVLMVLGAILQDGQRAGVFGPAHPFVVQIALVAPLMFFAASAPLRERARQLAPAGPAMTIPELDAVIRHVQAATLSVLSANRSTATSAPRRSS